MTTISD